MTSQYSTLKVELIDTGDQTGTWGDTTNDNFSIALGEAITGSADVPFATAADQTLTLTDTNGAQTARNLRLNLTESGAGIGYVGNVILGTDCQIEKLYLINNTTTGAKTIKNTSGTGIAVPAGKSMFVYNNGTNVVDAITHLSSLTLGSALPVLSGGTGVTTSTGSGANVLGTSPSLTTPTLGTPASGNLDSCTADGTNKVGYRNIPLSGIKTSSYTLVAGDVGKFIELGTSGTVVVPASIFTTGDVISIFNNTSGSISCTCSAITDFYKGGTDTDISTFSVTTRGVATILFITATRAVVTGNLA